MTPLRTLLLALFAALLLPGAVLAQTFPALMLKDITRRFGSGSETLEIFRNVTGQIMPGEVVEAFVGLDGGSTSTKAVLLDRDRNVLVKSYQLSKGNPIVDTQEVLSDLEAKIQAQGATLKVMGIGTTGYAKDILKDTLAADVALV